MKGFIYLLEISVALILMLVVLGTLSSYKSKENWERADLVSIGNNVLKNLDSENVIEILNENLSKIEKLIPSNVGFGLKIKGIPKNNISVGCVDVTSCNFLNNLLTKSYANNHWINFSIEQFNINSLNYIPSNYDAVVFVNYTEYTSRKSNITDYLNKGGVVTGINATFDNNNADFNEIFGLSPISSGSGDFNFTEYDPLKDEVEKYFLGLGFDINTNNNINGKKWGYWYIWGDSRMVNITSNTVDIENKTSDEGIIQGLQEDEVFNLKYNNKFYTFKVKKIFWDKFVIIQPVNTSFVFKDFSETNDVTGKNNIIVLIDGQAEMTSNNTAIWISDFPESDEYKTLVKAGIVSRVKEFDIKEPELSKEHVSISSFFPLCCDMPETAELMLYLWYKI